MVKRFDQWAQNFLKKVIQGVDDSEMLRRTDAILNLPAIRERLDRMPAHIRATAAQVVRGILAKLKNVAENETEELIEWVLRYYESNVLRELREQQQPGGVESNRLILCHMVALRAKKPEKTLAFLLLKRLGWNSAMRQSPAFTISCKPDPRVAAAPYLS